MKTVTVVEVNNIAYAPPIQTLVRVLLSKGYRVNLIGNHLFNLIEEIRFHQNYHGYELPDVNGRTKLERVIKKLRTRRVAIKYMRTCMENSDYLWTATMETIIFLGKEVLRYKNVMELLELAESGRMLYGHLKIPVNRIALRSWKVVTVEINRAYIQKTWWELPSTPFVIPNKPFSLDFGTSTPELEKAIERMKTENKKIVFYLGVINSDRDFLQLAKQIYQSEDYAFYLAGRVFSQENERLVHKLETECNAVYLGAFDPPNHLALVKYAHIGLLPYRPIKTAIYSELNALYCAPNKIWEYAGFGVPMVGSDVLGLKLPFEQWNIGCCCDINDGDSIKQAIDYVDAHHEEMSQNCYKFYDSVDLNEIVEEILEDDN